MIVPPSGSPHRTMLTQLFGHETLRVAVEASGWELMLQFASYGIGAAIVNDFCTVPKGLAAVPLADAPAITYYAFRRRGVANQGASLLHKLLTGG